MKETVESFLEALTKYNLMEQNQIVEAIVKGLNAKREYQSTFFQAEREQLIKAVNDLKDKLK